MKTLMMTVAVVGLMASGSAAWAQAGGQGGRQGQGEGQTQSQTQGQGSPDWNAYYRNNPDLQKAYEANRSTYQANGESTEAFAARHYREHGQAEGRALPRAAVASQPSGGGQSGQSGQGGQFGQGQGQRQGQGFRQDQGQGQGFRQDQGQGQGSRQDQGQGQGLRQDQGQGQGYRQDQGQSQFGRRQDDQGPGRFERRDRGLTTSPNANWRDWSRRWGDQNRSVQRRDGQYFDGRNWRSERFNPRDYNRNIWAQRRFRIAPYHQPRGWYARRWTFGQTLPFVFFSENYWISDYWSYGLTTPPYGCEWVRYGDDALLVDIENGEILQAVYRLFY